MFGQAPQCTARRQLMEKGEEQPELSRIQILLLFYTLFIKPKSYSLQLSASLSLHTLS